MLWLRSSGLRGVRKVVEEFGGDADALVQRAGAPAGTLDSDELVVSDAAAAMIFESAAQELRCPDFGLRVALEQDMSVLGPLAIAILNAPTVADALECTSKYLFVHANNLMVAQVADPRGVRGVLGIRWGVVDSAHSRPQTIDGGMLFIHRALLYALGGNYGLRTVELPHVPLVAPSRYEELFGAQVNFAQPAAVLRVPADLMRRPILGSDNLTRQLALSYLETQAAHSTRPISGQVRTVLRQVLGTGPTSVRAVAEVLSMSPRTLQRHLTLEGETFAAILDGARRDRADVLLTTSDLPLAQVASTIGLDNPATLSRYARRWWGTTARHHRQHNRRVGAEIGSNQGRSATA
ncbi:AraC family transcriptional regulator ligand-binding domain-containing protein [Nocardia sp. CA-119907]|uniref:AraC family transcriptional regulator n=1 Tax=Nocardia sp. CA-119907 TaxID=3239973 RepID=UPI003D98FFA7